MNTIFRRKHDFQTALRSLQRQPQMQTIFSIQQRQFATQDEENSAAGLNLDSFARHGETRQVRQPEKYFGQPKAPKPEPNEGKKPVVKDQLDMAYLQEFKMTKSGFLQSLLEMSNEQLQEQCRKFKVTSSDKNNENIQKIMGFLDQFERKQIKENPLKILKPQFLANRQSEPDENAVCLEQLKHFGRKNKKSEPQAVENSVATEQQILKHFGKKKQEQIDAWLEMDNAKLIAELERFELPQKDRHIYNVQTLFNYLKNFERLFAENKRKEVPNPVARTPETNTKVRTSPLSGTPLVLSGEWAVKKSESKGQKKEKVDFESLVDNMLNTPKSRVGSTYIDKKNLKISVTSVESELNESLSRIFSSTKTPKIQSLPRKKTGNFVKMGPNTSSLESFKLPKTQFKLIDLKQGIKNLSENKKPLVFGETLYDRLGVFQETIASKKEISTSQPEQMASLLAEIMDVFGVNSKTNPGQTGEQGFDKKQALINLHSVSQVLQDNNPNLTIMQLEGFPFLRAAANHYYMLDAKNTKKVNETLSEISKSHSDELDNLQNVFAVVDLLQSRPSFFEGINYKAKFVLEPKFFTSALDKLRQNPFSLTFDHLRQVANTLDKIAFKLPFKQEDVDSQVLDKIQQVQVNLARLNAETASNDDHGLVLERLDHKNIESLPLQEKYALLHLFSPDLLMKSNPVAAKKQEKILTDLLKSILTQNMDTSKYFGGSLNSQQMLEVVSFAVQMPHNRELQNQLRNNLTEMYGNNWTNEEVLQLFKMLEKPNGEFDHFGVLSGQEGGHMDSRLSYHNMVGRNTAQTRNVQTPQDLKLTIDLMEYLYETNPLTLVRNRKEYVWLFTAIINVCGKFKIPLEDITRFARITTPSILKPTFLFSEILKSDESFKTDVSNPVLNKFVDSVVGRIKQSEFQFDHLKHSISFMHSQFQPYTKQSLKVLAKVITDLSPAEISANPKEHVRDFLVINKILSNNTIAWCLFNHNVESEQILSPLLTAQIACLDQLVREGNTRKFKTLQEKTDQLGQYQNLVNTVASILPMIRSSEQLSNKIAPDLLRLAIRGLKIDLANFEFTEGAKAHLYPLEEVIKLHESFMNASNRLNNAKIQSEIADLYEKTLPFTEIIESLLRNKLQGKEIDSKIPALKESVDSLSMRKVERLNGPMLTFFLNWKKMDPELVRQYLLSISNSRSLVGKDLIKLFDMTSLMGKHPEILKQFDTILINVASNLHTAAAQMHFDNMSTGKDLLNEETMNKKRLILRMYIDIFKRNPGLFSVNEARGAEDKPSYSLQPLSDLIADQFDKLSHGEVLNCMKMLSSSKIDNYSERLISKLYEKYSSQNSIETMFKANAPFFFEFSRAWPQFLRNNALFNQLTNLKNQSSLLAADEAEIIGILTIKNVLHPKLIDHHFETFTKLKDKQTVFKYLKAHLHTCAKFGYNQSKNMEEITNTLRRSLKGNETSELTVLLDFLLVLANSNKFVNSFDEKNKQFVEQALELIEKTFTGTQKLTSQRLKNPNLKTSLNVNPSISELMKTPTKGPKENFDLTFFSQMEAPRKTYNKFMIPSMSLAQQLTFTNVNYFREEPAETDQEEDNASDESEKDSDVDDVIKVEDADVLVVSDDESTPIKEADASAAGADGKKSYERNASDSQYTEEAEYLQYRSKKMEFLNKRDKHMLIYSNINSLNFVDLNSNDVVKAWAVLFHFKGKSQQSMIYEEFFAIAQRNTIGKSKSHELFSKLYFKLMEHCFHEGYVIQMSNACPQTGWPIDISLQHRGLLSKLFVKSTTEDEDEPKKDKKDKSLDPKKLHNDGLGQQQAIYFLLQEEVCFNAATNTHEPLGVQKLMLRHLQTISDYRVHLVKEEDLLQNFDRESNSLLKKMGISTDSNDLTIDLDMPSAVLQMPAFSADSYSEVDDKK